MITETQYDELLVRIERENPAEPLLPALRGGYSRVNALFMAAAANRLPEIQETDDVEQVPEEIEADATDVTLNSLYSEKSRLFTSLYKQSNVFHTCRSDQERAENSRAVLAIWDDILQAKARITYYLEHGELPKETAEGDDLPDNPVLLSKKLNSIRAQISQIQKRLLQLAERPDTDQDKTRLIRDAEEQRRRKIHLRGLAEQKLKILSDGQA